MVRQLASTVYGTDEGDNQGRGLCELVQFIKDEFFQMKEKAVLDDDPRLGHMVEKISKHDSDLNNVTLRVDQQEEQRKSEEPLLHLSKSIKSQIEELKDDAKVSKKKVGKIYDYFNKEDVGPDRGSFHDKYMSFDCFDDKIKNLKEEVYQLTISSKTLSMDSKLIQNELELSQRGLKNISDRVGEVEQKVQSQERESLKKIKEPVVEERQEIPSSVTSKEKEMETRITKLDKEMQELKRAWDQKHQAVQLAITELKEQGQQARSPTASIFDPNISQIGAMNTTCQT